MFNKSFADWQRQRDFNCGFREAERTMRGEVLVSWMDGARKNMVTFVLQVWQVLMMVIAAIVAEWLLRHMS